MLAVIQLVTKATVRSKENEGSLRSIGNGLVAYLGVSTNDTDQDTEKMVHKILNLRIFPDGDKKMNLSIRDVRGEIMLISQFTLLGDLKGNNRPNFMNAAGKELATIIYEKVSNQLSGQGISVTEGFFGEHMEIAQENDGPVTIIIDTKIL